MPTKKLPYNGLYYDSMEWGYNGDIESDRNRADKNDDWFCYYNRLKRMPLEWNVECMETARNIYDSTNLPIVLLMSGGVDSIAMAESFRLAGVPFTVATCKFKKGYNEHDIKYAIDYCKGYGIKQNIIDMNIKLFWKRSLLKYAEPIQCRSPLFLPILWLIDKVDGYPVVANGEPWWYVKDGEVWTSDGEQYQNVEKWLIYKNREGTGKFFKYTTELKISGMIDPHFLRWIKYAVQRKYTCVENQKESIYNKHFNVGSRPAVEYDMFTHKGKAKRSDYSGFEYLSEAQRQPRARLEKRYSPEYDQYQDEPFLENLFRFLCDGGLSEPVYNSTSNRMLEIEDYIINSPRKDILDKIWKLDE